MEIVRAPSSVSLEPFSVDLDDLEVKYGLPADVTFCQSCVISNQRPTSAIEFKHTKQSQKSTVNFNDDSICDACITAQEKHEIDWERREAELIALCDKFRSRNGSYDCVVPGSGGKDSVYAAHVLKYKYGMNPITVTWAPHIFTPWGWNNFQNWIHSGFDNNLFTPNGLVHRLLTRLAVDYLFHPFQPFILGQKNLAPKLALMYDIPLIFYGENEAEYGNPKADAKQAKRDHSYFSAQNKSECFISGISVEELESRFGMQPVDLEPYLPADADKVAKRNVEVHYLGYYLKWHPQSCYYYAQEHCGFSPSPERTPGTYSKYNSIDDRIDDLHYYTTFIKFGIGRATYDASQEIRSGDIDRDEGVALVKKFDGEFPERFIDELFEYLSIPEDQFPVASKAFEEPVMTREYFMKLADTFRSPHLWKHEDGEWALRHAIWK
jgi:N-acetyl sugar amidotransferase